MRLLLFLSALLASLAGVAAPLRVTAQPVETAAVAPAASPRTAVTAAIGLRFLAPPLDGTARKLPTTPLLATPAVARTGYIERRRE